MQNKIDDRKKERRNQSVNLFGSIYLSISLKERKKGNLYRTKIDDRKKERRNKKRDNGRAICVPVCMLSRVLVTGRLRTPVRGYVAEKVSINVLSCVRESERDKERERVCVCVRILQ